MNRISRPLYEPIYAARLAKVMWPLAFLAGALVFAAPQDNQHDAGPAVSGKIQGKLWVVPGAQASNAVFPVPTATPDATFSTNSIAYLAQQVGTSTAHCFSIQGFLKSCGTTAYNLAFSGLPNANLGGAAVGPSTPMNGNTWGVLIEFTGSTTLASGSAFYIVHDDGISLNLDGAPVANLESNAVGPTMDCVTYTGMTTTQPFDLLYGNIGPVSNDQAFLIFSPTVYNSSSAVTCSNQVP